MNATTVNTTAQVNWVKIDFEEWVGSRNYGKFVAKSAYGIKNGDWVHLVSGGRKSLKGSHILAVASLGSYKPRAVDAAAAKVLKKKLQK